MPRRLYPWQRDPVRIAHDAGRTSGACLDDSGKFRLHRGLSPGPAQHTDYAIQTPRKDMVTERKRFAPSIYELKLARLFASFYPPQVSRAVYSATLKLEAAHSSEMPLYLYQITRRHMSDDSNNRSHHCENIGFHSMSAKFVSV